MSKEVAKEAVRCVGVTKNYLSGATITPALRGATLTAYESEILFLVGPSGCGKTTLISVIAGILSVDSGEVEVLGRNLRTLRDSECVRFRRDNLGFVFQAFNLIPTLTVLDNVAIPLLLKDVKRPEAHARAAEMLIKVGLESKILTRPTNLSGGQQQRVAIARALVHTPKLIVCDEPTSALDEHTGASVMELLRSLAKDSGSTLIIVTHDSRVYKYADRIATMNDGVVIEVQKGTS